MTANKVVKIRFWSKYKDGLSDSTEIPLLCTYLGVNKIDIWASFKLKV